MATIIVEGLPHALIARLRSAAAASGRSLNSEVIVQLLGAAGLAARSSGGWSGHRGDSCAESRCGRSGREGVEPAAAVGWGGPPAAAEDGRRRR